MLDPVSTPACALLAMIALTASIPLRAQEDTESLSTASTSTPYAEVQSSTLTGSTNVINLTMVPVVKTNGTIAFENLTVPLKVSESTAGVITVAAGTITTVAAPPGAANGFKAGTYYGPGSSAGSPNQVIALSGPGVTSNGATEWSLAASASAKGCTYPISASFYVGSLTANPLYSRLKAAGITSSAFSYGTLGAATVCGSSWWDQGAILGFSQTGNAITILSFTQGGTTDFGTPGAQITFTY